MVPRWWADVFGDRAICHVKDIIDTDINNTDIIDTDFIDTDIIDTDKQIQTKDIIDI